MMDHTPGHLRDARNLLHNASLALRAAAEGVDEPYGVRNELALLSQAVDQLRRRVASIEATFSPTQPAGRA